MALPKTIFDQDSVVCEVCESSTTETVIIEYKDMSRDLVLACRSCWVDYIDSEYIDGDDPEDYL